MSQAGIVNSAIIGPTVPTSFVEDVGTATPVANILNIRGGIGIMTSGSGNTVTITATGGGFTWNVVTSATNPNIMAANNGYITKGASQVVLTLPAAANVGDMYSIVGYGNLWQLQQNANQQVFFGTGMTTLGIGGSLTATAIKDRIEILCVTANLEFEIITSMGNITTV